MGPDTLEASFYSPDGEISFADPCYLDGVRDLGQVHAAATTIPFAAGAGEYVVHARVEEVAGWGRRVVAVEVRPLHAGRLDGGWSWLDNLHVDTATISAFSPSRLVIGLEGDFYWEALARVDELGARPEDAPYAVSFATGFGDGSYPLEVLEGADGILAARIVFIEPELDEHGEDE